MRQTTFSLIIGCAGDVPKGVDPKKLYYLFGLDGKLRAYKDVQLTQRVRIRVGSTWTKLKKG